MQQPVQPQEHVHSQPPNNTTVGPQRRPNTKLTHLEFHSTSKECTALHGADELHIAGLAAVVGKRKIIRRVLRKSHAESFGCGATTRHKGLGDLCCIWTWSAGLTPCSQARTP